MASWEIRFTGIPGGVYVGRFAVENLTLDIVNSEEGGFTCELPLSATQIDSPTLGIPRAMPSGFAPKRSDWEIWRGGKLISAGILTEVNLNTDRDTMLLAGRDWIWYLKQRIYPFNPEEYVAGEWDKWPKRWPETNADNPVDISIIVRALVQSLDQDPETGDYFIGARLFSRHIPTMNQTTKYTILPGDTTTIFDHIQTLSERAEGFEFDIEPGTKEFNTYSPRRDSSYGFPEYIFKVVDPAGSEPMDVVEGYGQIIEMDWTNEGPNGTYLVGLGTRDHRVGRVWTDIDTALQFGRYDLVYDYGELSNQQSLLAMLKDQQDLWPQKNLSLTLLNPEYLGVSFYSGSYPRGLVGRRVRVFRDFLPYTIIQHDFRINSIRWTVDQSTNEQVELGLEMLYPPDVID